MLRWQLAVPCAAVRRHRGVATPRQWAARALRRTTPARLGLVSLVTRDAHPRRGPPAAPVRQAAWYHQALPTVPAARALVRRELWTQAACCLSARDPDMIEFPRAFVARLAEALCSAT